MKKIIIGLGAFIIGVSALITVNPGNIFTPWLMKISRGPAIGNLATEKGDRDISYSTLFTVKAPKPITTRQVTKLIVAELGGTISVIDADGMIATLNIPAGALQKDTTIIMAPLQEVPIVGIMGALSSGVVIEPEGLKFLKNAQLVFDYKSVALTSRAGKHLAFAGLALTSEEENAAFYEQLKNAPPEDFERLFNESINGATRQLQNLGFPVGGAPSAIPVPAINPPQLGGFGNNVKLVKNNLPPRSAIIHVDHQAGRINVAETTRSLYGSRLIATIHSLSSYPAFDMGGAMGDKLGQNDLRNSAADAGGACTPSFISAMLRVASWQQGFGEPGGDATAMEAVQDCAEAALENMELRCEVDVQHVTRKEMVGLIEMLQSLASPQDMVDRAQSLMQSCKRIYSVSADVAAIVPQGRSKYGISAQLCGYLDEKWVGTEIVDYRLEGDNFWAEQVYVGDIAFTLPYGGGPFQMSTRGTGIASGNGLAPLEIPVEGDGQIGDYDGNKQITVFYNMYGHADVPLPIEITKRQCESTDEVLYQGGF